VEEVETPRLRLELGHERRDHLHHHVLTDRHDDSHEGGEKDRPEEVVCEVVARQDDTCPAEDLEDRAESVALPVEFTVSQAADQREKDADEDTRGRVFEGLDERTRGEGDAGLNDVSVEGGVVQNSIYIWMDNLIILEVFFELIGVLFRVSGSQVYIWHLLRIQEREVQGARSNTQQNRWVQRLREQEA
jgi:hypothetical protein